MNVVCGQCGTGYEFDDALVSDRGTTVRCTQCGFQFRVHSSRAPGNAPERWIVRKVNGEEYIFRSLSELQRAIAQRRVLITDSLSRDGATFRPLQQLSELDSFFNAPARESSSQPSTGRSPAPVSSEAQVSSALPSDSPAVASAGGASAAVSPVPPSPDRESSKPRRADGLKPKPLGRVSRPPVEPAAVAPSVAAAPSPAHDEKTPIGGFATNPPAPASPASAVPTSGPSAVPLSDQGVSANNPLVGAAVSPVVRTPSSAQVPVGVAPVGQPAQLPYAPTLESERLVNAAPEDRPTPTGALPRRRRMIRPSAEEGPLASDRLPSAPHLLESFTAPPRRRFGGPRWIVAVVLLGGGVLVAATVGRSYFASFRSQDASSGAADPRVAGFIGAGDEAFAIGDLEEARAQYEKASALHESVDVIHRLLSVEVFRADIDWLQLKIIPTENSERGPIEFSFRERCAKIQARVSQLQKVNPGAPLPAAATLALIDALRVLGQVQAARSLVERSSGLSDEPREAYVSAMLDVSEPNPNWDVVIARLKGAAAAERGVPRAQAALVYALVGARDFSSAQQELEILRARKRPHRATPVLERYLAETQRATVPGSSSETAHTATGSNSTTRDGAGRETPARSVDPMVEAAEARAAGELARAARAYSQALSQDPGNVAAMTGLGDVARSQGNSDIALSHYGAALRANPNYAPAVLACADLKWSLGDRAGAVELYRRLGDGPSRVRERVVEFEKAQAKAAVSSGTPVVPAPSSAEVAEARGAPPSPAPEPTLEIPQPTPTAPQEVVETPPKPPGPPEMRDDPEPH